MWGGRGRGWERVRERQIEKAKEREREIQSTCSTVHTYTQVSGRDRHKEKKAKKRENRAEEIRLRSTKKLFQDLSVCQSVCVQACVCLVHWTCQHTCVCMLLYLRLYTGRSNSTQDNLQQCLWTLKELFQDQKLSSTFVAWCWLPQKKYFDLSVDLDILLKQCIF